MASEPNPYAAPEAEIIVAVREPRRFKGVTVLNAFIWGAVFGLMFASLILFADRRGWLAWVPMFPLPW